MKKITLLLTFMLCVAMGSYAQVSINQSFPTTTTPAGWNVGSGGLSTTQACATAAWRGNVYNATPRILTSETQVSNDQDLTISFDYKIVNWSAATVATNPYNGTVTTEVSLDGGATWSIVAGVINSGNHVVGNTCVNKLYVVPGASIPNLSNVSVRWNCVFGTSGDYYVYIDNVIITQPALSPPNCASALLPTDLSTGIARNPVLSWTAATGGPTSYDVYFGTSVTPPLATNTATTSYTPAAPLLASTTYYWQVVAKNANGDAVGCATQSFTTGASVVYCVPTTTYGCTDGDVIARVTLNTLDNDSGTGCPSGVAGYSDYTADPNPLFTTTLQAGSSYGCTVYAGQYSEGYAAWVDYNDDGNFDNSTERIGYSIGQVTGSGSVGVLGSSATFPIVLACNPPLGQHRLRVRAMYSLNGSAVTPCADNAYGEIEDYMITISAAVACPQPSALAANNITSTSAELSWNVGCAETLWDVYVGLAGGPAPGAPTTAGVIASPFLASSLTPGTNYEFYVRADCTSNGTSLWTGPFAFATLPIAPDCGTLTTPADLAVNVPVVGGNVTLAWTDPATGPVPTGYNIYFGTNPLALAPLGNVVGLTTDVAANYSTTYYWQAVAMNAGGEATSCSMFSFTTEAAPPPPANDDCSAAINVVSIPYNNSQDATNATNNSGFIAECSGMNDGVWYTFNVTTPGDVTIDVTAVVGWDPEISVYTGSCGAFVCENNVDAGFADDPETLTLTALATGQYFINVGDYSGVTDNPEGPFTIDITGTALLNTASFDMSGFSAYPNPVKDVLNLSYTKEISSVSVFNLLGQEMMTKSIKSNQSKIDLSNLPSGTYLVKVASDNVVKTIKVVKQ